MPDGFEDQYYSSDDIRRLSTQMRQAQEYGLQQRQQQMNAQMPGGGWQYLNSSGQWVMGAQNAKDPAGVTYRMSFNAGPPQEYVFYRYMMDSPEPEPQFPWYHKNSYLNKWQDMLPTAAIIVRRFMGYVDRVKRFLKQDSGKCKTCEKLGEFICDGCGIILCLEHVNLMIGKKDYCKKCWKEEE